MARPKCDNHCRQKTTRLQKSKRHSYTNYGEIQDISNLEKAPSLIQH